MLKVIPFKEINEERWNGLVHYSLDGHPFGYYWYLKAVLKEFHAILEPNYSTAAPIIPLDGEQHALRYLPFMGPFSVNAYDDIHTIEYAGLLREFHRFDRYELNPSFPTTFEGIATQEHNYMELGLLPDYEELHKPYASLYSANIAKYQDIKLGTGLKVETFTELLDIRNFERHALSRIIYNAMHRGIGNINYIEDKNGRILCAAFVLFSHEKLYEIESFSVDPAYKICSIDITLRSHANKPLKYIIPRYDDVAASMGFTTKFAQHIILK